MKVKIENLINVWYDQIPTLFINLVNAIVLARDEKELREVIDHKSERYVRIRIWQAPFLAETAKG